MPRPRLEQYVQVNPRTLKSVALFAALLYVTGCDANFVDLRPNAPPFGSPVADAGAADAARSDADQPDATPDMSMPDMPADMATPDSATPPEVGGDDTTGGEGDVISEGAWEGRGSYNATGRVTLRRLDDGTVQLELDADFSAAAVPGPVVALSNRESIGGGGLSADQGDVLVAVLPRNSGAQTFAVPEGAEDRAFAWIYCDPFGVEIARATLEAPQ